MPGTAKQDRQAERLQATRLRYSINTHLEDQGLATPSGHHRRHGLDVPLEGLGLAVREGRGP